MFKKVGSHFSLSDSHDEHDLLSGRGHYVRIFSLFIFAAYLCLSLFCMLSAQQVFVSKSLCLSGAK